MRSRIARRILISAASATAALATAGAAFAAFDTFLDVGQNHWAREVIDWAYENHVMTGPGGQTRMFQPNKPATRAELAAVSFRVYTRLQTDIDSLSQRIVELERRLNIETSDDDDDSSGAQSSVSVSSSASSYSSVPSGIDMSVGRSNRIILASSLVGSEETPPVDTNGRGLARFRWTSNGLWYDITVNALSSPITGAHFHVGPRGRSGAILHPIEFVGNRAQGIWENISVENWRHITGNEVYVNVHTQLYPNGEIRGQLIFRR